MQLMGPIMQLMGTVEDALIEEIESLTAAARRQNKADQFFRMLVDLLVADGPIWIHDARLLGVEVADMDLVERAADFGIILVRDVFYGLRDPAHRLALRISLMEK